MTSKQGCHNLTITSYPNIEFVETSKWKIYRIVLYSFVGQVGIKFSHLNIQMRTIFGLTYGKRATKRLNFSNSKQSLDNKIINLVDPKETIC